MNKERRKAIASVATKLAELRDELDRLKDDEQEAFDALPENFQNGTRGEGMQAVIDALQEAYDEIDGAVTSLEDLATA